MLKAAPRYISIPAGLGLIIGGTLLAPLPVFGMWMAPLGLAILAPHSRRARRLARKMKVWSIHGTRWAIRNGFLRVVEKPREPTPKD